MSDQRATRYRWEDLPKETVSPELSRRLITGERLMLTHVYMEKGCIVPQHSHENEQLTWIVEGTLRFWLGDDESEVVDVPPDELNRIRQKGQNFGFPYCHGGDVADPEFGGKHACSEFVPPVQKLGPHVAAIGMRFYTGTMFPQEYRNQIFIAEHGSWNRDTPLGYRVMLVKLDGSKAVSYTPFAEGWLRSAKRGRGGTGDAWGRPADVLVMPDGALLVADDEAGAIYRISYKGN